MRYFIELKFDGSNYHGWQIQNNAISVQEVLNQKLSTILRENIEVTGAGRTDTGVHANQMMAHFDVSKAIDDSENLLYQLNSILPKDISLLTMRLVKDEAHARFDALSRQYIYRITSRKDPFENGKAWFFPHKLNLDKMNSAGELLKTFTDFSCFSKSGTQTKTNDCKITEALWHQQDNLMIFTITADRFLRNMVRAIVGTMTEIGQGKLDNDGLEKIILSGDRSKAGLSVPAHGLYLNKIEYPESIYK